MPSATRWHRSTEKPAGVFPPLSKEKGGDDSQVAQPDHAGFLDGRQDALRLARLGAGQQQRAEDECSKQSES